MQEPTNIFTSLLIYADFVEDSLEPFITMMIFMGMIIALMLPIIAIPYIFIKLGSVAAKIQAAGNKAVRNTAMGRNAVGKAARGAASRGIERKAGKWAARGDGGLRSKVGGYKTQRDFKRQQQSAIAKRDQEDALATRIQNDSRYQRRAGGDHALAAAQSIINKRQNEETENADAQIQQARVFTPDLGKLVAGRTVNGVDGTSEAVQRAAFRRIVAAEDGEQILNAITTGHPESAANKLLAQEEIQRNYSAAKKAAAHAVTFSAATAPNGWSKDDRQKKAVEAFGKLAADKAATQDGPSWHDAAAGYKLVLSDAQALHAKATRTADEDAELKRLVTQLTKLKANVNEIHGNSNTYNLAKGGARDAIDEIRKL